MSAKNVVRASVVQTCSAAYSLSETLDKLDKFTRMAAQEGAQLAVFPEALYVSHPPLSSLVRSSIPISVGGYPKHSTFGCVVGDRKPDGRDEFVRYHAAAIEVPGSDAVSRMEAISKETNIFLVVGVIERDLGTLYCTVVFVDPVQGYVAKHRKLVPTAMERLIWGQGRSTTLPVHEAKFVQRDEGQAVKAKLSSTICW